MLREVQTTRSRATAARRLLRGRRSTRRSRSRVPLHQGKAEGVKRGRHPAAGHPHDGGPLPADRDPGSSRSTSPALGDRRRAPRRATSSCPRASRLSIDGAAQIVVSVLPPTAEAEGRAARRVPRARSRLRCRRARRCKKAARREEGAEAAPRSKEPTRSRSRCRWLVVGLGNPGRGTPRPATTPASWSVDLLAGTGVAASARSAARRWPRSSSAANARCC